MKNDKYLIVCIICGKEFKTNQKYAKYCSSKCRSDSFNKTYGRYGGNKIPQGSVGSVSELVVSIKLLEKGYTVFRSVSPNGECDLIVMKEGELKRIEVKTGYINVSTKNINYPIGKHNKHFDVIAVYVRSEESVYFLDKDKKQIFL